MKKIVITGGHLTPALALIEQFKKEDVQIIFIGRKHPTEGSKNLSTEYRQIPKLGIKFYGLTTGRFQRKFTSHTIPSILKIPMGLAHSFFLLLIIRPSLVVSFGGYLSTPVVFSAWLLGIKSITHEQSAQPGLATKINAIFAQKTYLSWPQTAKYFTNAEVIGNPIRRAIFQKNTINKQLATFVANSKNLVYITGGNLGSHFINQTIFKVLETKENIRIVHQTGIANQEDYQEAQKIKNANYYPIEYVQDGEIGAILNSACLVISRSGANTVCELAVLAKVAILCPLPIAGANEQFENAKILETAGSSVILLQGDLSPESLSVVLGKITKNMSLYQKKANQLQKNIPQNSAQILASRIITLINEA